MQGKHPVSPLQGFVPLWQKTYRMRMKDGKVLPTGVITVWKKRFAEFWPKGIRFYGPISGIAPGGVGLINAAPIGLLLWTGVMVLYADDESFTFMTPEGHVFASWITFSAYEEDNVMVAQIETLMRTNDPIYELFFRLGFSEYENRLWRHTLKSLAAYFDIEASPVEVKSVCVDRKIQWSHAKNIWFNAGARTMLYVMATPVRMPIRWWHKHHRHADKIDTGS